MLIRIITAMAAVAIATSNAQVPTNGLVASFPFSGTVNDASGNNNNGMNTGAAFVPDRFGNAQSAISMTGTESVTLPSSIKLTGNMSISFWLQTTGSFTGTYSDNTFVIDRDICYGANDWSIGLGLGGKIQFNMGPNDVQLNSAQTINDGTWKHIVVTRDSAQQIRRIYINGLLSSEGVVGSAQFLNNSENIIVGACNCNGASHLHYSGKIDDINFFNRVISTQEISQILEENGWPGPFFPPQLISIPSPTVQRRPVFAWFAVQSASSYTIDIDSTRSFTTPITRFTTTHTSYLPQVPLPIDTIYWRVKADNTSYSQIGAFVIQDTTIPLLIKYLPKITQNRRPILQWHPVANGQPYTISIANSASFANPIITVPLNDTLFTQYAVDLPIGPIYWRVKSSLSSTWSVTDTFSIISDSIPFIFRFNGATLSTSQPGFKWNTVSGAGDYRIQFGTDRTFTSGYFTFTLTDTAYTPSAVLANGAWFWRVSTSRNYSLYCPLDSFGIAVTQIGARAKGVTTLGDLAISRLETSMRIESTRGTNPVAQVFTVKGSRIAVFSGVGSSVSWNYNDAAGHRVPAGSYCLLIRNGSETRSVVFFMSR